MDELDQYRTSATTKVMEAVVAGITILVVGAMGIGAALVFF